MFTLISLVPYDTMFLPSPSPQEFIRHKLEEEQRQLEILQQQLLQEQALLMVISVPYCFYFLQLVNSKVVFFFFQYNSTIIAGK